MMLLLTMRSTQPGQLHSSPQPNDKSSADRDHSVTEKDSNKRHAENIDPHEL